MNCMPQMAGYLVLFSRRFRRCNQGNNVDIVGVTSSILVTPTILFTDNSVRCAAFGRRFTYCSTGSSNRSMLLKAAAGEPMNTDIRQAILDAANSVAAPGEPVSLLEIGPVLVLEKKYTELEVLNALFSMQAEKVIELLNGNRMRVL